MDNPTSQQSVFNNPGGQQNLPNATAVLVLGIVSIIGCFCYGIIGLICGIIALVLAKKDLRLYNSAPGQYALSSYNNLKAGRICAIIGVILSSILIVIWIIVIITVGTVALSDPNAWRHMNGM